MGSRSKHLLEGAAEQILVRGDNLRPLAEARWSSPDLGDSTDSGEFRDLSFCCPSMPFGLLRGSKKEVPKKVRYNRQKGELPLLEIRPVLTSSQTMRHENHD